MRVGIIGGGLCGLTAAIRLAQRGVDVELFEAAPKAGGRTRSFFEPHIQQWVDNGPHLLSGAYQDTLALLAEAGAADNITWQASLSLPLWDEKRGHFLLQPNASLPLTLGLPLACMHLPGHDWADIPAFLRLAYRMRQSPCEMENVQSWLDHARITTPLLRDLLQPLCLGAMNEELANANAASFKTVLQDAFASHSNARLGWFRMPLSQALIEPLVAMATGLGVRIHHDMRIRSIKACRPGLELESAHASLQFDACIIALPLRSGQQLLGLPKVANTRRITNIHMWFRDMPALSHPFIGGIDTTGQWFFDVSSQMDSTTTQASASTDSAGNDESLRHICAVISADDGTLQGHGLEQRVCVELAKLSGSPDRLEALHSRIVSEHHATTSVAGIMPESRLMSGLPANLIDACEAPRAGELPATIEYAVKRGNQAADQCYLQLFN